MRLHKWGALVRFAPSHSLLPVHATNSPHCNTCHDSNNINNNALRESYRTIIVPRQLKAYGGNFSRSIGERNQEKEGNLVLQSLASSRIRHSPLLSCNIKTKLNDSFHEMNLSPQLHTALQAWQIDTPSPIQQNAIETIMAHKSVFLAAPHGQGKTLAYLLPLYENMLKDRDVYKIPLRERRPRMMILAPTRELIKQVQHVCHTLDTHTGLKSISFTSCKRANYHISRLLKDNMADVLIMDPKLILRLLRARRLFIEDLRYIVIDEADVMMSDQHDFAAAQLLMKIRKRNMYKYLWPVQTQIVFASAYITRKLEYIVGKQYPNLTKCLLPAQMHRPQESLSHKFIPIHSEPEKLTTLIYLLNKHGHVAREVLTDVDEVNASATSSYINIDNNEAQNAFHKLHGSLEEYKEWLRDRGILHDTQNRNNTLNSFKSKSLQITASPSFSKDNDGIDTEISQEKHEKNGKSTIESYKNTKHINKSEYDSDDHKDTDYHHDFATRAIIEHVKPIHWEHLSTTAAPFSCPIKRTVFAPGARTIIFTHTIDATIAFYHHLQNAGFAVALLHASLPHKVRSAMYKSFASGEVNILCATDVASRGLDLHVDVVINMDMPTNSLVYLSRGGRAARMGRTGMVYSLYTKQQGVIVSALRAFVHKNIPLEGMSNHQASMMTPRYAEWRMNKTNALARSYVSLITRKTIPAHLEKTYLRHNATWRPIFHPQTVGLHGGVPPNQQNKIMNRVMFDAIWFRREQMANRKGGKAKFGAALKRRAVWNDVSGAAFREMGNVNQDAYPAGESFGPPQRPP